MNVNFDPAGIEVRFGGKRQMDVEIGAPVARYVIEPYVSVEETEEGALFTVTAQGVTTTGTAYNGEDGKDGKDGADGESATISVGTTTTGAAGTPASVTNSGTPSAAVLNFVIPKGDTGAAGADGKDGSDGAAATIAVGTVTTGQPTDPASVTNSGTSSAAVFDFVIPKGDKGDTGSTGSAATIAVGTTTTGAAGTSASVTNSGTSSAAVFNFTIPKGDKGDTGPAGTTDYNDLTNKPTIPSTAADVGALPDSTKYALSTSVGGSAKITEGIPFGEVASTSTSTAFTATVAGITELKDGTVVMLKNGVVTSAANFTININNLGAKPVYSNMATGNDITPTAPTRETTIFNINYTLFLVYSTDLVEGGAWINYRGYNSDNNTIGYQIRTNSYSLPMDSVTYRYRLLFTSADGTKFVPANNSTSTNATASRTVCQSKIDPFGAIVYYGTTASVAAGSRPGATALWSQYVLSLGYSFNRTGAALTLTSWKPVYVKAEPQTDGSAIIDSTTPYVQALPSTADGKIYIFLGIAYSATNIELALEHPVYYYKDGAIRLWTNQTTGVTDVQVNGASVVTAGVASVSVPLLQPSTGASPSTDVQYGSIGTSTYVAHADHRHPTKFPTTGTPADLGTAAHGTADTYARSDHVHNNPLPSVSSADNGKALVVNSGVWDVGNVGGGGIIIDTISGTTPTISAVENHMYICDEVTSISFTPCQSGLCAVRFTSGSTPTVLTLPGTVKMPDWWAGVDANRIYELNIMDGVYGVVMSWA